MYKCIIMDSARLNDLKTEVKDYLDHADERVTLMIYNLLKTEYNATWWEEMPDSVRTEVEASLLQADKGEVLTHQQVKEKYPQWFTK